MADSKHCNKIIDLNEAQENRILEALAHFRQDIMEEMKSLRQMMKEAFDKSVVKSQCDDYVDHNEVIFPSHVNNIEYPQDSSLEDSERNLNETPTEKTYSQSYCVSSEADHQPNNLLEDINNLERRSDNVMSSFVSTLSSMSHKPLDVSNENECNRNHDTSDFQINYPNDIVDLSHNFYQAGNKDSFSTHHARKQKLSDNASTLGVFMKSVNEFRKESGFSNHDMVPSCIIGPSIYENHFTFERPGVIQMHTNLSSGMKKEHKCKFCNKLFSKSVNLNNHIMTHTGVKPFTCSVCNKGFIRHEQLKCHFRTHTGEKPYACPDCGRRFSYWSNYSVHKRTHTGEKPYKCEMCQKCFTQLNSLKRHKQCAHLNNNL